MQITEYVKDFYEESNGVLGYRQMCITINREKIDELSRRVNVKRVRRIMRILGLKSVIRRKRPDYVKSTPEITAATKWNKTIMRHIIGLIRMDSATYRIIYVPICIFTLTKIMTMLSGFTTQP